ncbi:MAG TPA: DUF692 family protein [Pyrinomonadaceae bacterium]
MEYLNTPVDTTAIGLAYGPNIPEFIATNPGLVDYIEVPFEQLRHAPHLSSLQEAIPVVLHCASMSVAGFVPPTEATLAAIKLEAERTRTPWIGEHLAFVNADGLHVDAETVAGPTALTYTVCPQMSEETVERVAANLAALQPHFAAPLILENSPQYFSIPGSTMPMVDFINAVSARSDVGLLLDLTHFLITMLNTGSDAAEEIGRLPLERVVEIHVSGLSVQSGVAWDDHATPAPAAVFDLLERVLERARPRALTVEYNWSPSFPQTILKSHLERVRRVVERV